MVVAADRVAEDFPLIGEASVPGRHINDHQKRLFMKHRQNDGVAVAAAKAGRSTATGYRLEKARSAPPPPRPPRGRRRPDPPTSPSRNPSPGRHILYLPSND